jgi:serine/threonine protein phosphatase 1
VTKPLAIVGDVHGEARQLSALIREIRDRRVIFVGDYVNRGSDPRGTLDLLLDVRDHDSSTVFLLGNHEVALLDFLSGSLAFHEFAALGGIPTIKAYLPSAFEDVRTELLRNFPESHHRFLDGCEVFFETPDIIVSHCGVNPDNPASREKNDMVTAYHHGLFSMERELQKLVVCGHYAQASGVPYVRDNLICLDTGCGTDGGPLTALLMPEREFIQR